MNKRIVLMYILLINLSMLAMSPNNIDPEVEKTIQELIAQPSKNKKRRLRKAKSTAFISKKDNKSHIRRTISAPISTKKERYTLLMEAIKDQDQASVKKYICKDIVNRANKDQRTPLMLAVLFNSGTIVQLLLNQGADPNRTNRRGNTPLHSALLQEKVNAVIVQLLINAGTRLILKNNNGYSIKHMLKKRKKDNPALKKINVS